MHGMHNMFSNLLACFENMLWHVCGLCASNNETERERQRSRKCSMQEVAIAKGGGGP